MTLFIDTPPILILLYVSRIVIHLFDMLTEEEAIEWERLKKEEEASRLGSSFVKKNLYRMYPSAVRHYISLFPNNHLNIEDLNNEDKLSNLVDNYLQVISDSSATERKVLNWIRDTQSYFIVASMLKRYYSFGHHDTFL
ncbi:hypothetical protein BPGQ101_19670 [Bacillus altitudinis]|uniref:hypothetical protein n=1 Tax=Bacillus altitudinis TaxID=293387 RepID=UPI0010FFA354|nr:hypothetical protein [Bacillus altitudinis]QCU20998.1 hypothetical protein BPGQ101_19670 [Bacillus altitudinis]